MILFNVLLVVILACLIRPALLAPYMGGKLLPRWVFLVALLVLVSVSPYGVVETSRSLGHSDVENRVDVEKAPDRHAIPSAAPAVAIEVEEPAASIQ